MANQVAVAQAAVGFGARTLDEGSRIKAAGVAKQIAASAAGEVARIAHQVFGAIGVTEEHELHHLTRRLWQWRQDEGSDQYWSEVLGGELINAGGSQFWPALVGEWQGLESATRIANLNR